MVAMTTPIARVSRRRAQLTLLSSTTADDGGPIPTTEEVIAAMEWSSRDPDGDHPAWVRRALAFTLKGKKIGS